MSPCPSSADSTFFHTKKDEETCVSRRRSASQSSRRCPGSTFGFVISRLGIGGMLDGSARVRRAAQGAKRSVEAVTTRPPDPRRVLITGAAGRIGTYLRERLSSADWQLRLLDSRPFDDDRDVIIADIRDESALAAAMRDVDAVVHLAGISVEAPLDDILAM